MTSWRWLPLLVLAMALSSCSNDDGGGDKGPDPDTPFPATAPTSATMQIDTVDLEDPSSRGGARGICHALSALAVAWVDANVVIRLAVPSGALNACLLREPVYLGDDTWRWTASGGTGMGAHTGELTAHVAGQQVDWSMRVSGTQYQLDRFLWFEGTCDAAAHAGFWKFYEPLEPETPLQIARIDWSRPSAQQAGLTIENTDTDSPDLGDQLHYAWNDPEASIEFVDARDAGADTTRISWSAATGSGTTIAASGDTCCWGPRDQDYPDVLCP
jgi:hypothetical protein